jgi:hypothetical protein
LPDKEYFENYTEYRRKLFRPNRELEIYAFISLQHLIISRLGQEIGSANNAIFGDRNGEECDMELLQQAQEAMHIYCELACLSLFLLRQFNRTENG